MGGLSFENAKRTDRAGLNPLVATHPEGSAMTDAGICGLSGLDAIDRAAGFARRSPGWSSNALPGPPQFRRVVVRHPDGLIMPNGGTAPGPP